MSVLAGLPGTPDYKEGAALLAGMNMPKGVVINGGQIYWADTGNCFLRKLNAEATLTSRVAGVGCGFQDGDTSVAQFSAFEQFTFAPSGEAGRMTWRAC